MKTFLDELSGPDFIRARQAALQLGRLRDALARVALEAALHSPDAGLRVAAASALGSIGEAKSRSALESSVGDTDWRVRAQAAYALSRLHDVKSTTLLATHLVEDESALVRNACALALGRIGDPRSHSGARAGPEGRIGPCSKGINLGSGTIAGPRRAEEGPPLPS